MTDWIEWKGGECPVPPDTMVEVRNRSGVQSRDFAGYFRWDEIDNFIAIVAYRVISEKPKPEEPKPSQG